MKRQSSIGISRLMKKNEYKNNLNNLTNIKNNIKKNIINIKKKVNTADTSGVEGEY